MVELNPNAEVIEGLSEGPSEGRHATVLLISYRSDEQYTAWIDAVLSRLQAVGGRIAWAANDAVAVVGDPERSWDTIVVVEYPNLAAFLEMIRDPAWAGVDELRVSAMDANEIYACTPVIDALDRR